MTTEPAKWRLVVTDSEGLSGVAPLCAYPHEHETLAIQSGLTATGPDSPDVYDCCQGPHIECWSEPSAEQVVMVLNATGAEVCS